jgi:hypothetical protein
MEPRIWGKYVWTTLHVIALGYPDTPSDKDKADFKDFYLNFWKVIPCQKCADNYRRHLSEIPSIDGALTDSVSLFRWTVDLHNIVNKELGQPVMTYQQATEMFARLGNGDHTGLCGVNEKWEKLALNITYIVVAVVAFGGMWWIISSIRKNK